MSTIEFAVDEWIASAGVRDDPELATLASLRIEVLNRTSRVVLTEVDDTLAATVRHHVYVPLYPLARWFLVNWWRLRWEPYRDDPGWRLAHSMAAIGAGYVWPPIEFASDGEFVQIHLAAEEEADVSAIRYLRTATMEIPASSFEHAVMQLVELVQARLRGLCSCERDLVALCAELTCERQDPRTSTANRWKALAGLDPEEAPPGWFEAVQELSRMTGPNAIGEVLAVLPELSSDLAGAREAIDAIKTSCTSVDLSWIPGPQEPAERELPWQKGARIAAELRRQLGVPQDGVLHTSVLEERLNVTLASLATCSRSKLGGAFRRGHGFGEATVRVPSRRPEGQRFHLSRVIGCALASSSDECLLPVTDSGTALQKFERAFAQEFLCPWSALDAFTGAGDPDEEKIATAAEHFQVSELLVLSTLVNKGRIARSRLAPF